MFKKLLCLTVILGIAGSASATTVVFDNAFHGVWGIGQGFSQATVGGENVLQLGGSAWAWGVIQASSTVDLPDTDTWVQWDMMLSGENDPSGWSHLQFKQGGMWSPTATTDFYSWREHFSQIHPTPLGDTSFAADTWYTCKVQLGGFGGIADWTNGGFQDALDIIATQTEDTNLLNMKNIKFIPEPATIAMLGFGGLALIRRKRS